MSTNKAAKSSKWIRIDKVFPLPKTVRQLINKLNKEGFVAYIVGGSVRDFLLNQPVKDHDVVTNATPEQILKIFSKAVTVGKAFGVIKVEVGDHEWVDVATFREDLKYTDHRHPSGVKYSGPEEDATRRDFTVNGLFYDPKQNAILDCVDGLADIKSKTLRAIGEPNLRFKEDALRLIRAVRFKTILGFSLEPETEKALTTQARLIAKISTERIREEFELILQGPVPGAGIELLKSSGLLFFILPELESLCVFPIYWKRLIKCYYLFSKMDRSRHCLTTAWALVFYRLGVISFLKKRQLKNLGGYERYSIEILKKTSERLRFSNNQLSEITSIIELHVRFKEVFQMREATLKRFIREPLFEPALLLHKIDALTSDGNLIFYEFALSQWNEEQLKPIRHNKLLNGEDLIDLGLQPGPRFSKILKTIEDLTLEGKLIQRDQALEYVISNLTEPED